MKHISSAVGAGKIRRATRFIREDGRAFLVALDMQSASGDGPDHNVVERIATGGPDGILVSWQVARRYPEAFRRCGLILRIDGATTMLGNDSADDSFQLMWNAEQAALIGADAVVMMAFPGADDEGKSLRRLAAVVREGERIGMPVIAESIPGTWARTVPWDTEHIARAARICVENGADAIKTPAPPETADVAVVVANTEAPVFILGGPKMESEDAAVQFAADVIRAGAAGIAFGRNAFGADDPTEMTRRLAAAVHGAEMR
jgi:class I fructose-bisphosphate aldolase/fructose-bisphosphate aldolase/2-amino-3,7-dideoxy-D-threo-hept-6-ulosonate synthase